MEEKNLFEMEGKVIGIYPGNRRKRLLIFMQLSSKCFVYVNVAPDTEVSMNDYIKCSGRIVAYSYKEAITGRYKAEQRFIAEQFEVKKSEMEEKLGVKGRFADNTYRFRAYIIGQLIDIKTNERGWERIMVRVGEEGASDEERDSSYIVCNYRESRGLKREEMNVDDLVAVVCDIYTPQKEVDGKMVSFQNLIVKDIKNITASSEA